MTSAILVSNKNLDKSFSDGVFELTAEWKKLHAAHHRLAEMTIHFGKKIQALTQRARNIDKGVDGAHERYLREQISAQIGTSNPSILSKWVAIGAQAPALLAFKNSLPNTRDGLYEIALAAEEKKPIERWIEQGKLSAESSVRDVQALRRKKKKRSASKSPHKYISVTLTIESSYSAAAIALIPIVQNAVVIKVSCESGFREVVKSELGKEQYIKLADKFSGD